MPGPAVAAWLDHLLRQSSRPELRTLQAGGAPLLACGGFVLLLTPTGSLPSPRSRRWARVAAAAPLLLVLLFAVDPHPLAVERVLMRWLLLEVNAAELPPALGP